jgi:hypothetical protein
MQFAQNLCSESKIMKDNPIDEVRNVPGDTVDMQVIAIAILRFTLRCHGAGSNDLRHLNTLQL